MCLSCAPLLLWHDQCEHSKAQQAVFGAAGSAHCGPPAAPRTVLAVQYMAAAASSLGSGASPGEYRRAKGVPSSTCSAQSFKIKAPHSKYTACQLGLNKCAEFMAVQTVQTDACTCVWQSVSSTVACLQVVGGYVVRCRIQRPL